MRAHNIGIYGSWEKYPRIILKYSSYMEIDSQIVLNITPVVQIRGNKDNLEVIFLIAP